MTAILSSQTLGVDTSADKERRLTIHLLGIGGVTTFVMLITLLPFLPGQYDSLAVPLSTVVQVLSIAGLLLVPVGAFWAASRFLSRLASRQHAIAMIALVISSIVWLLVSLGAFASGNLTFGAGALILWAFVIVAVRPWLRALRSETLRPTSAVAFYLLIVPVAVVLFRVALVPGAVEFSRNRAIGNSARLIAGIEAYRERHGRYPSSLLAVWKDYSTGVIGIEKFHYEPSGDAYNLFFEQFSDRFGTREFVVYNPGDRQVMTSHAMDLLEFMGGDLDHRTGYYAVHDTAHAHWKYFWFD